MARPKHPLAVKNQCLRCTLGEKHEINHGANAFARKCCSCDVCAEAHKIYSRVKSRQYRERHQQRLRSEWAEKAREANKDPRRREEKNARQRRYRKENLEYCRKQDSQRARNQITGMRNGFRWTPAEDEIIKRADISVIEMCFMVGRSFSAVSQRKHLLKSKGEL